MVQVEPLERHPHFIDRLTAWFEAEWPEFYATQPPGAARAAFLASNQIWLVALDQGRPLGVVGFRDQVIGGVDGFSPALGGLFVDPARRREGVGRALLQAAAALAFAQGHSSLYLSTIPAVGLVRRLGWREVASVDLDGERHPIFALDRTELVAE